MVLRLLCGALKKDGLTGGHRGNREFDPFLCCLRYLLFKFCVSRHFRRPPKIPGKPDAEAGGMLR
jgi:hypothetical protein